MWERAGCLEHPTLAFSGSEKPMATTNHSGQETSGIDNRTKRAAEGSMVAVPHGDGNSPWETATSLLVRRYEQHSKR
jgi:hypothetical protein